MPEVIPEEQVPDGGADLIQDYYGDDFGARQRENSPGFEDYTDDFGSPQKEEVKQATAKSNYNPFADEDHYVDNQIEEEVVNTQELSRLSENQINIINTLNQPSNSVKVNNALNQNDKYLNKRIENNVTEL